MNKKRSARAPAGHTLVELLAAAAIAAVLASLAAPGFRDLILDNRRATVVNELVAALTYARLEAAKRGQTVIVCGVKDADGDAGLGGNERACLGPDWSGGWMTASWNDVNADGHVAPTELTLLREHLLEPTSGFTVNARQFAATPPVNPAGTAALRPFGTRSSNGTLTVCDRRGPRAARAVIIAGNGRTRVAVQRSDGTPLTCP